MDNKNIVKEGFFDSLVRAIIPKDLEKESAKLSNIIAKELEKQYGYKTNKKKISDFIKKRK